MILMNPKREHRHANKRQKGMQEASNAKGSSTHSWFTQANGFGAGHSSCNMPHADRKLTAGSLRWLLMAGTLSAPFSLLPVPEKGRAWDAGPF